MVSVTLKQDMLKYFHIQLIKILLLKTEDQEKNFESTQRKMMFYLWRSDPPAGCQFLVRNYRVKWHNMFIGLKGKNCQPRILYPVEMSSRRTGWAKPFSNSLFTILFEQTQASLFLLG